MRIEREYLLEGLGVKSLASRAMAGSEKRVPNILFHVQEKSEIGAKISVF